MVSFIVSIVICGIAVIAVGVSIVWLIHKVAVRMAEYDDKVLLVCLSVCMAVLSFFLILYCADIPSALNGGETVYTNELPDRVYYMHSMRTVSDNPELRNLKCFNPDGYDKYGNYRIRYTKLNRIVLAIEKLD